MKLEWSDVSNRLGEILCFCIMGSILAIFVGVAILVLTGKPALAVLVNPVAYINGTVYEIYTQISDVDVCRFHCDMEMEGHGFTYWHANKSCECLPIMSNRLYWERMKEALK